VNLKTLILHDCFNEKKSATLFLSSIESNLSLVVSMKRRVQPQRSSCTHHQQLPLCFNEKKSATEEATSNPSNGFLSFNEKKSAAQQ